MNDPHEIQAFFQQSARQAGLWASGFLTAHADHPKIVVERRNALLQALSSTCAYSNNPTLVIRLTLQLNAVAQRAAWWGAWEPYVEHALQLARRFGDHSSEFELLTALGDSLSLRGQWVAALPHLAEAMALSDLGGIEWMRPFTRYAESLLWLGRYDEAADVLQAVNRQAVMRGDDRAYILITGQLGRIYQPKGEWQQAIVHYQSALTQARARNWIEQIISNLSHLGVAYTEIGQYAAALDCLSETLERCQEINERSGEATTLVNIGAASLQAGSLSSARHALLTALPINRFLGHPAKLAINLIQLGRLFTRLNEFEAASDYLNEASQIVNYLEATILLARLEWAWGEYYIAINELAASRQAYFRSQQYFTTIGETYFAQRMAAAINFP